MIESIMDKAIYENVTKLINTEAFLMGNSLS